MKTITIYKNIDVEALGMTINNNLINYATLKIIYNVFPKELRATDYPGFPEIIEVEEVSVINLIVDFGIREINYPPFPITKESILNSLDSNEIETICYEDWEKRSKITEFGELI